MKLSLIFVLAGAIASAGCEKDNKGGEPPDKPEKPVKPREGTPMRGGDDGDGTVDVEPNADSPVRPPKAEDLAEYTKDLEGDGPLMATIETSMGTLECELFEDKVPRTVANFVGLARGMKAWKHPGTGEVHENKPYYDGIKFHRVIPEFMLQTGDPLGKGMGGPGYTFADEFDPELRHDKPGIMSMANSGPGTNGSQFFITEVPTPHLDDKHSVFGQCDNIELIKKIARVPKLPALPQERGKASRPKDPPTIVKITIHRGTK